MTTLELAFVISTVLLLVIARLIYRAVAALNRVEGNLAKLDALNALKEQTDLLKYQNSELDRIAYELGYANRKPVYVPPTVRFCDRCRGEYPESNRWWTVQFGLAGFKLCSYPKQKETPADKWLHGEECAVAELRTYTASVLGRLLQVPRQQKREYTEYSDGERRTRLLNVSHCGNCEKEYSEAQLWWTVSVGGMEVEVREGFGDRGPYGNNYYFCSDDCVVAAVKVFIASQSEAPQEWNDYLAGAKRHNLRAWVSAQASTPSQTIETYYNRPKT